MGDAGDDTRSGWADHQLDLHGHRLCYRAAGRGAPVLLVHGLLSSSHTWLPLVEHLGSDHRLIAPDLFGHGASDKHDADYTIGGQATVLRDLLVASGHERVTVVGHSYGGGVALQFAYQFPERVERLVLVGSGGLGAEVSPLLRATSLPGSELVLGLVPGRWVEAAGLRIQRLLSPLGWRPRADLEEMWRAVVALGDPAARRAFLRTTRAVIGWEGQRVSAADRLHLAAHVPTLIVWGDDDPIIPVEHARATHAAIPESRLEIVAGGGHWPHLEDPHRVAAAMREFIATTAPARFSPASAAELLAAG